MSPKKNTPKAPRKATTSPPARRAAGAKPAKRQTTPERVNVGGLRTLGDVEPGARDTPKVVKETAGTRKARQILTQEFEHALSLKDKLVAEAVIGGKEKGRDATRRQETLRAIVNSLEGMNRFALQMGLVTPAQARELYAQAMQRGLYEGWR